MDWFVKAFLKSSVTWLSAGVTLGVAMAVRPSAAAMYRLVHMHMLLLGFVAMMIFGVAYHVIPRFVGHPLHSARAAGAHWWLANIGLAAMALGFGMRAHGVAGAVAVLGAGGMLSAAGAYTFAFLIWRTIDGRRTARTERAPAKSPSASPLVVLSR